MKLCGTNDTAYGKFVDYVPDPDPDYVAQKKNWLDFVTLGLGSG